jgi:hypothetical protein
VKSTARCYFSNAFAPCTHGRCGGTGIIHTNVADIFIIQKLPHANTFFAKLSCDSVCASTDSDGLRAPSRSTFSVDERQPALRLARFVQVLYRMFSKAWYTVKAATSEPRAHPFYKHLHHN